MVLIFINWNLKEHILINDKNEHPKIA